VSEIPYVNRLGDALDAAIAAQPARAPRLRRLGRRRYLAVALAALAVGGGGAAVAGLFADPVEIGFGAVGCFEQPSTDGNVAVTSDPTRSPIEVCSAVLAEQGFEARDLIACSWSGHGIVVLPHGGRASCAAHELLPVPASYDRARLRAERLQALAVGFERDAGCLAPAEFARRLTAELRAAGWARWRAVPAGGDGPCGRVSVATGSSLVGSIGPAVDATERTIAVKGEAPLAVERLLFGPGSPGVSLFESSGARCFTVAGLERHVREVLAPVGLPVRFSVAALAPNTGIADETGRAGRYADGCAVFAGVHVSYEGGRLGIVAELTQRDAPMP
jgi:hypothetical protein